METISAFDNFITQVKIISQLNNVNFLGMTKKLIDYVQNIPFVDFLDIICEVGTIPERIDHDSTEEKLYSKATDIVLSRAFVELGLKSRVLTERANSADVLAESMYHNYSLVADAKAFRLSRTAKNQKDFKVKSMSDWRGNEHDFAVLVAPYNQYPNTLSQIYSQALNDNICLLSWEHLYFLLSHGITETVNCNLAFIWNISNFFANNPALSFADRNKCFIADIQKTICRKLSIDDEKFTVIMKNCIEKTVKRGEQEIEYWQSEKSKIESYSREQAISELIKSKKINEKIRVIRKYILTLKGVNE